MIRRSFAAFGAVLALFGSAVAQETPPTSPAPASPALSRGIEGTAGYLFDFRRNGKDQSFYKLLFMGNPLSNSGTPFLDAEHYDITLKPTTVPASNGDRSDLSLRFENGTLTSGGSLFEALGVRPLNFRGLQSLGLRGAAYSGFDFESERAQFSVGLETSPLHLATLTRGYFTNWLIVGVNAQHQESTDSAGGDADFGQVSFQAFVGREIFPRPRVSRDELSDSNAVLRDHELARQASKLEAAMLKQGNTPEEVGAAAETLRSNTPDGDDRTGDQNAFLLAVGEAFGGMTNPAARLAATYRGAGNPTAGQAALLAVPGGNGHEAAFADAVVVLVAEIRSKSSNDRTPDENSLVAGYEGFGAAWAKAARRAAIGAVFAMSVQPTLAFYVEDTGYFAFTPNEQGGRLKNLFTATIDYYFLPERDDVTLRLRYENGHDRAAPTLTKNNLMLSVAFKF